MRDWIEDWEARGINVVLVGSGNAAFAEAFREDFELAGPILVDPELVAYRAAGLRRNAAGIANPRLLSNALRAFSSGARQSEIQGDPWQLGGLFVFAPGGELRLARRAKAAGDAVDPAEIDAALAEDAPLVAESEAPGASGRLAGLTRPLLDWSPLGSFDRLGFARHAAAFDPDDLAVDLYGRRCLVTGANAGIGFETACALADLGAEVVMLCRSVERGDAAGDEIRDLTGSKRVSVVRLDVSDLDDIEARLPLLAADPVDVLVHNAGVLPDERRESNQGLELCFATHVAGPHRLTAGLRVALAAEGGGRVVWVSSGGMLTRKLEVDDPQWRERDYDGVLAYAETKRAQVVLAECWADALRDEAVDVHAMHPGWCDTASVEASLPLFHKVTRPILRSAEEGADTVVWLAASPAVDGETGQFYFDREVVRKHWLPSTRESESERRRYWEMCRRFEIEGG